MRTVQGFTMIELMVTIAIAAVLFAVAAPSFSGYTANQRIRATSFDLVSDLTLARSEALKRAGEVQMLPVDGDWNAGWTVSVVESGELLRTRDAVGRSVSFDTAPEGLTFNRSGQLAGALGIVRLGLVTEASGGPQVRCITIDPTGRPKLVKQECP